MVRKITEIPVRCILIDLGISITMQMLYPKFLVSNVDEVTLNQLHSSPLQISLVVLSWKRCNLQLDDNTVGKLLREKEANQ